MSYNPEKYRDKREKVLGIRKRGVGFGAAAIMVSLVIIAGLAWVTVPQAVSYMTTRNLDDAIFKLESASDLSSKIIADIKGINGVKDIVSDKHDTRLVVTFDRRTVKVSQITALFGKNHISITLLNRVNHRQHQNTIKEEAEGYEAS